MPKFFVKENQVNNNQIHIIGEDVNHIKNVLRMKIGDTFNVCNEDSSENYKVEIKKIVIKKREKILNK